MPYAVCNYGIPAAPSEIEIVGFRLSLPEAFAMLMARTVTHYRFARAPDGIMDLHILADEPRQHLPIDYVGRDCFRSANPDDEVARADIMRKAGEQVWHGLSIVEHDASVPSPAALKLRVTEKQSRAAREIAEMLSARAA
ncbi:MAG TPA: hypothetical protein VHZ78_08480 [Rhizomicrobium sp.]|jgi:hypothetical protein|nr:hypothetical protein [Rhizomicrobium sp.]